MKHDRPKSLSAPKNRMYTRISRDVFLSIIQQVKDKTSPFLKADYVVEGRKANVLYRQTLAVAIMLKEDMKQTVELASKTDWSYVEVYCNLDYTKITEIRFMLTGGSQC